MKLPKDRDGLREIFLRANPPTVFELKGEYDVEVLTGPLPSLKKLKHRKAFFAGGNQGVGYNILFRATKWGWFILEADQKCPDLDTKAVKIKYQTSQNFFLFQRVSDYIKKVELSGQILYLGRIYLTIWNKPRFLGFFSLTKVNE